MIKTYFRNIAYSGLAMAGLASCNPETEGLGEETDKGKVFVANVAQNTFRRGANLIFDFRDPSTKPDSVVGGKQNTNVYMWFKYNGNYTINAPLGTNSYQEYKAFAPGTLNLEFDTVKQIADLAPPLKAAKVGALSLPIEANKYYSVFVTDSLSNPGTLVLNDDLSPPTEGKVKIRILNLSFDAGPIDITLMSTRQGAPLAAPLVIASNLAYKNTPTFFEINPGFYDIRVSAAGTTNAIVLGNPPNNLSTTRAIALDKGSVYTLWFSGIVNRASRILADTIVVDNTDPRFVVQSAGSSVVTDNSVRGSLPNLYFITNRLVIPREIPK